jgi:hypothetical protein
MSLLASVRILRMPRGLAADQLMRRAMVVVRSSRNAGRRRIGAMNQQ